MLLTRLDAWYHGVSRSCRISPRNARVTTLDGMQVQGDINVSPPNPGDVGRNSLDDPLVAAVNRHLCTGRVAEQPARHGNYHIGDTGRCNFGF